MAEKKIQISKDDLKIEDGKVVIDSQELSNIIQEQNFDCMVDEEANSFITINKC